MNAVGRRDILRFMCASTALMGGVGKMPFSNSVLGGDGSLVRTQEKSVNYVPGVSGWVIKADGTAEFNNGTFRGSLAVGTAPGQRFIVNPGNGDVLDVYNASNQLIANIDSAGTYSTYQFLGANPYEHTSFSQEGLQFISDQDSSGGIVEFLASDPAIPSSSPLIELQTANDLGQTYTLSLFAPSHDGTFKATALGTERGFLGSLVQSDQQTTDNLIHVGSFANNTDAAANATVTHGAQFTPTKVFVQVHDTGLIGSAFGVASVVNGSVNNLTFQAHCMNFNGTPRTSAAVAFWYICIG